MLEFGIKLQQINHRKKKKCQFIRIERVSPTGSFVHIVSATTRVEITVIPQNNSSAMSHILGKVPVVLCHLFPVFLSIRLMNERQSFHDSQYKLFVGAFSNYGG